jgi:hypothetical protein
MESRKKNNSGVKNKKIFSVDVETSGPDPLFNGILSIGYCLGDFEGNVLEKKRIDLKLDVDQTLDSQCFANFWSKPGPAKVLKTIQKNPVSSFQGIKFFVSRLDQFDKHYDLQIITDNPSFDLYFLNFYISKYLNRRPLNYKFGKSYRRITDSRSFQVGKFGNSYKGIVNRHVKQSTNKHDHFPDNDAEYIYRCYIVAMGLDRLQ